MFRFDSMARLAVEPVDVNNGLFFDGRPKLKPRSRFARVINIRFRLVVFLNWLLYKATDVHSTLRRTPAETEPWPRVGPREV